MSMPERPLRLGTRASPLAMAQAHLVRDALCAAHGWSAEAVTLCPVTASGDKILDRALAEVGGKALWTKELDEWLFEGHVDFSVHSMKDVETIRPAELIIAAMLPRADVRDRLVGAASLEALPQGARIGTSSPRRQAQLLAMRPDFQISLFRGNVNTRLAKLAAGEVDATLLAAAGLDRLDMGDVGVALEPDVLLPAPSQGAIGIECRSDDAETRALLSAIAHAPTMQAVAAERAFLAALTADCRSPVAAQARVLADGIALQGQILLPDGSEMQAGDAHLSVPEEGAALATALLERASPALRRYFGQ
jgi:hydroxymethylbilane synthase